MRDDDGNTEQENIGHESVRHAEVGQEEVGLADGPDGGGSPGVGAAEPRDPEAGLATAEYAVATVAAVGFAGLLIAVLKSGMVKGLLEGIISSALSIG
ncbi:MULTISPECIES: DUF4244 domain-containing protein [unclassified Isoptericola]|uniref:DUF4244 domain-containing protein n=1 Tax=unclassified Isoptericola TaxID=2623355 RepID=UPI0036464DB5